MIRLLIGLVNFLLLQWFGVRLVGITFGELRRYMVLRWVWPLTGWWSDFRFIGCGPEFR